MSESKPLDELYFEWLYKHVGRVSNRNPANSYWKLAKLLYTTPFNWWVGNDDDRAADGRALRHEFIDECDIQDLEVNWLAIECSLLELLIALARRAAFESYGVTGDWFWKFMENLNIKQYSDLRYNRDAEMEIKFVLRRFVERTYRPNGEGGIFPLRRPSKDQRHEELCYQMSAYLLEDEDAITG